MVGVAGEAHRVNSRVASPQRGNDLVPLVLWLPQQRLWLYGSGAREGVAMALLLLGERGAGPVRYRGHSLSYALRY